MGDTPIYEEGDVVTSESQAWIMTLIGGLLWVTGWVLALAGMMSMGMLVPVLFPLSGVCGIVSVSIGLVQISRASGLHKAKKGGGAKGAHIVGGILNTFMGILLLGVGAVGLGLGVVCGLCGILVALAD